MTKEDAKELNKQGNTCIGLGAGVGALGAGAALVSGALCPLCVFVTPLLIGAGVVQKVRARFAGEAVEEGHSVYDEYLSRAFEYASKIDLDVSKLPTKEIIDSKNYIKESGSSLELWFTERGEEELLIGGTVDTILYEVFYSITFSLASEYESKNRDPNLDSRRLIWKFQHQLMSCIKREWGEDLLQEIQYALLESPYSDTAPTRPEDYQPMSTEVRYTKQEVLSLIDEEVKKLQSSESQIAKARSAKLLEISNFIEDHGYPILRSDFDALSLIPYYFQEANYDDLDWTTLEGELGNLKGIFNIDFALHHGGLRREKSPKRVFNRYIWSKLSKLRAR